MTAPPRWLADEMLGRLARYLRLVGCDTAYFRGRSDDELLRLAVAEHRLLLTRDRELSRRSPATFRVQSPRIAEQWRELRDRWPSIPTSPTFDRCPLCNALLLPTPPIASLDLRAVPAPVRTGRQPLFVCSSCGHLYWEGSHTARIRERLARWATDVGAPPPSE